MYFINKKKYCNCGKKICNISTRCKSCAQKGKRNNMYKIKRTDLILRNKLRDMSGKNNPMYGIKRNFTEQHKQKISKALRGKKHSKEHNKKVSLSLMNKKRPLKVRIKLSKSKKLQWQNKKYREKQIKSILKGLYKRPNSKESLLIKLLNYILPKQYKYVGNGKIIIGGYNPDFINCNGKKTIIELYGDYWHKNTQVRDKQRLKSYKKYGYKTLVVWEHELKDINRLKNKILKFNIKEH